jgi:hypothetical protein
MRKAEEICGILTVGEIGNNHQITARDRDHAQGREDRGCYS